MLTSKLTNAIVKISFLFLIILGCKKEDFKQQPLPLLSVPVANAGPDATIYLPDQRDLVLDGSKSYDPDAAGRPLVYLWQKLSGPEVLYFHSNQSQATLTVIEAGIYNFELQVTDADKHLSRDTVTITALWGASCNPGATIVNSNYQVLTTLDEPIPIDMSFAKGGRNLVFAGGRSDQDDGWGGSDVYSSKINVYDMVSKATTKNSLSLARGRIGVAVGDKQVFFAGGILLNGVTDIVDILDLTTNSMSKASLSVARSSISCEIAGNKVFFAGGRDKMNQGSDVIDIYDLNSNTWSVAKLSLPRAGISIVSDGTKVFFAGGDLNNGNPTSRVDIYDLGSGQWSTMELASPRYEMSSSYVGNKVVFAGGYDTRNATKINQADFLDPTSLVVKSECLLARTPDDMVYGPNKLASVVGNRDLYYLNNYLITRYQSDTQKWSMTVIPPDTQFFGLAAVGNDLFGLAFSWENITEGYSARLNIYKIGF